jgi:hypothetical protein
MIGHSPPPRFYLTARKLLLVPCLSAALTVVVLPADANPPDVQGKAASADKAQDTLPGAALAAPQYGRPAGTGVGRKN